ncbi:RRP36 [Acanthosepion pharaonis]|uniref:rRNA biogenesis protein RRP36 n=1 Tax=Acanthosepion pharaonis TaxID=158019 RepID=A0A812CD67_ACAPH|nr:RRP36 [Sepia pharaonis]
MEEIHKELSEMTFEELQKFKDKVGINMFNKIYHKSGKAKKKKFQRENKNRPMEMSSKKPVSRHRNVIPVPKKIIRDPRFDNLSGEYNEQFFQKAYSFIDDVKEKEKRILKKKLKKTKDPKKQEKLHYILTRMEQQKLASEQDKKQKTLEHKWRSEEKEMIQQGKKPYFLKKSDKKLLEIVEKYKELKEKSKATCPYFSELASTMPSIFGQIEAVEKGIKACRTHIERIDKSLREKHLTDEERLSFLDCQDRLRNQIKKHEKELKALRYENLKSMILAVIFFCILCVIYAIIHIR